MTREILSLFYVFLDPLSSDMNQEKVEDEVKRLCGLIQRGLFYDAKIMFDKNPELISVKDDVG